MTNSYNVAGTSQSLGDLLKVQLSSWISIMIPTELWLTQRFSTEFWFKINHPAFDVVHFEYRQMYT